MRCFNEEYERDMTHELRGEDTSFSEVQVDLQLKEGDTVKTGVGEWLQVLETPGHTRDCLSYLFPDSGVLVVGEAAGVPDKDFIHSVFLSSYEDYANSIEKILLLNVQALCIAHVGILIGRDTIADYLHASLASAQEYRVKLERHLKRFDGDRDKVVEAILEEEYDVRSDHIQNRNPFIANLHAKINAVLKLVDKTGS
jgi:glyoxylase-like metal-dependent hydrolase (beta-lactamase superfamily II)